MRPFRADWLVEWQTCPPKEQLYIVIGVDPAVTKRDTGSQTALVVVGQPVASRGPDRLQAYVLQAEAGHWTPKETAARLLELTKAWRPRVIRIEDVAYQRALKDVLELEAQIRGVRLPAVDPVKPERDKLQRALGISPWVQDGRVRFGPGQTALTRALLAVPQDAHAWGSRRRLRPGPHRAPARRAGPLTADLGVPGPHEAGAQLRGEDRAR